MERLTIPDEKIDGGTRRTVIDPRKVKEHAMTIYWALKKYEDTGLTPEQIIKIHGQSRWIPVEERLPEENGFYIATMDGEIVGQEEPFVGLAEFEDGKWIDDEDDYKCVIAWRPLPEPYQPRKE